MKKVCLISLACLFCLSGSFLSPSSASALSTTQQDTISQYCGTIRQTLHTIQHNDSRIRIQLGADYETILSDFITPLNIRLTKNNIPSIELSTIQTDFIAMRSKFQAAFTKYSQTFDDLLASNCQTEPEIFYANLKKVRSRREDLRAIVVNMQDIITNYQQTVQQLEIGS